MFFFLSEKKEPKKNFDRSAAVLLQPLFIRAERAVFLCFFLFFKKKEKKGNDK
jgi:hypothetical protein